MFKDKTLLITGGTGSFGNAVLNRFLGSDIKEIRIFSRDEKKQDDMRRRLQHDKVKFFIGDVRDYNSIDSAMRGVDFVFHANDVEKVVVLSTDKAVYPINAMGMSKAMMEKTMVAKSRNSSKTILCGTRYGNVMASRGSVIPLFVDQIKKGAEITITDPNMTRFMMTLDDAVDLVLFAFEHANSGDIFVQKAPAATIEVLAKALKELYNGHNDIKIIGTRHGEKLYESLVNKEDMIKADDLDGYYRIPADNRDLNYERYFSEGEEDISKVEDYHSHNTHRLDVEGTKQLLLKLDFIKNEVR